MRIIVPIAGLDLLIQYVAGMLTTAYAPAQFTQNTDFGVYNLHVVNGFALGIILIAAVAIAGLSRTPRNVVATVVAFLGVLVAGFAGMAFVGTTPNDPVATVTMSLAFLVSFSAMMALSFRIMAPGGPASPPVASGTPPPSTG